MTRMCFVLFFVSVLATYSVNAYLMNRITIVLEDIPMPREIVSNDISVEETPMEYLLRVYKKCAEIGEFCNNNSDCCSHSCLGFMKRCVS